MSFTFVENVDKDRHDAFVLTAKQCTLLQSSKWGEVKDNWGHVICGVEDEEKHLIASAMILIKKLQLSFTFMYIPHGPIMDYDNRELVNYFFQQLKRLGRKYHALFIKMDPMIIMRRFHLENCEVFMDEEALYLVENIKNAGGIHQGYTSHMEDTIQPRFQAETQYVSSWKTDMPKKARKELDIALKKHIEIEMCGKEAIKAFTEIMQMTQQRKGVALRNEDYFEKLLDIYGDNAKIFLAKVNLKLLYEEAKEKLEKSAEALKNCPENAKKKHFTLTEQHDSYTSECERIHTQIRVYGEKAVACGVLYVSFGKTSEILYAGMNDDFKRYMAPIKTWCSAMEYAFERGCRTCNMGGIDNSLQDGLIHFKQNFHPYINEFAGEFDIAVYKTLYTFARFAYKICK